jgi:hypothetical protein
MTSNWINIAFFAAGVFLSNAIMVPLFTKRTFMDGIAIGVIATVLSIVFVLFL